MNKNYKSLKYFKMPTSRNMTPSFLKIRNIEPHWHDFFEFELFLDGNGVATINDTSFPIKRGLLYFVTTPDIHSATIEKECAILNVSFDISIIKNDTLAILLTNADSFFLTLDEEDIEYFSMLHSKLYAEFSSMLPMSKLHAASILETMLIFLLKKQNKDNVALVDSHSMQKAIKYINLNFTNKISLQDAANTVYMTREHFSRKFHEYVGQSFSDYILNLKLKHAKNLLATTQLSIADITNEIGFWSATYFSRIFKRNFGISPSEYRKNLISSYRVK